MANWPSFAILFQNQLNTATKQGAGCKNITYESHLAAGAKFVLLFGSVQSTQGVSKGSAESAPKRHCPKKRLWLLCPSLWRRSCNTSKRGGGFGVEEEGQCPPSHPSVPTSKEPLWGALQAGADWALGVCKRTVFTPGCLCWHRSWRDQICCLWRLRWHTLLILPLQMPAEVSRGTPWGITGYEKVNQNQSTSEKSGGAEDY